MKHIQLVHVENEVRVDSRIIAKRLGIENRSSFRIISNYMKDFEEFGLIAFEIEAVSKQGARGKKYIKYALLNEDQCYLLLTYSKNTPEARRLKVDLVKAFSNFRKSAFKENVLKMFLLPKPLSWEKRFKPDFYKALARVTNTRYTGHTNGTPFIYSQITDKWVYGVIMPSDVHWEMKARKENSQKLHQWLTNGGLEALDRQIKAVTMIANSSVDRADFNARCMQVFGKTGQLAMVYPNAC